MIYAGLLVRPHYFLLLFYYVFTPFSLTKLKFKKTPRRTVSYGFPGFPGPPGSVLRRFRRLERVEEGRGRLRKVRESQRRSLESMRKFAKV